MKEIKLQNNTYLFQDMRKYVSLPDGWMIISTTKDITEEQAASIVSFSDYPNRRVYQDYETKNPDWLDIGYFLETAKESLQSLIQANGLDINKNYLILRKI